MLLARALRPLIRTGRLTVIDADGNTHVFGSDSEPAVTVRLHDRSLHWELALNPGLHAGEAWMNGTLTVEDGKGLYDFLELFGRNLGLMGLSSFKSPFRWLKPIKRRWHRLNDRVSSERNVAHHYDLSGEMYGLFLDSERQYTCAYHPTGNEDLETAQRLKERHIAAKLQLAPGMRVLDFGCGWGSLAICLARHHDVDVTAVTLSKEQVAWGNARAARARPRRPGAAAAQGLSRDRRHVRPGGLDRHARACRRAPIRHLVPAHQAPGKPDGVALIHSIGRVAGPGTTNAWIRKYIFPGGYIPALSEVLPAIERAGLWVTDIEVLRVHYAHTLRQWRERFMANRDKAAELYDERFVRMWEYYLATSEISFRFLDNMNFQIQLAPDRNTLPLARDYMIEAERMHPGPRLVDREAGSAAANLRSLWLAGNGVELHAKADGPDDGPLVVLLHGFPEFWFGGAISSRHWPAPASGSWPRICVATISRTSHRAATAYRLDVLADDVLGVADALDATGSRSSAMTGAACSRGTSPPAR